MNRAYSRREIGGGLATAFGRLVDRSIRRTPRFDTRLCERQPPLTIVRDRLLPGARPMSSGDGPETSSGSGSSIHSGLWRRTDPIVRDGVRFAPVPADNGSDETSSAAGSSGMLALLISEHQRQSQRCSCGATFHVCAEHHPDCRLRLLGQGPVLSLDQQHGRIRDTSMNQHGLACFIRDCWPMSPDHMLRESSAPIPSAWRSLDV